MIDSPSLITLALYKCVYNIILLSDWSKHGNAYAACKNVQTKWLGVASCVVLGTETK